MSDAQQSAGVLVFDLGGVLFDFRGVESLARLSGGHVGGDAFARFWSHSTCADRLYKGLCSPESFAAAAVREFGLAISPHDFLSEFRNWLLGPYPGAFEVLEAARRRLPIACLSNTNVIDAERFRREFGLAERFDHCFFSNEIGHRKPDAVCYRYVAGQLGFGSSAGKVAFFDDNRDCVDGARTFGFQAYECAGLESLRATLEELGFLSATTGSRHP